MPTGLSAAARGYTFQDAIGGVCILAVLFEEAEAVSIEDALERGDKFDDIILERDDEQICFQVRNRPGKTLTAADLENKSSKFYLPDFVASAQDRLDADEGSRFIILTSHQETPGSAVQFTDAGEVPFFGEMAFPARTLADGTGEVAAGTEIEFVLGVPGIGTADDKELAETVHDTDLARLIQRHVRPLFDEREHPEISDPTDLVTDAVELARWARNHVSLTRLTRDEIVRRLGYIPAPEMTQEFPVEDGCIEPAWVQDLEDIHTDHDRILVEGKPGSGKSTGIELLHRDWAQMPDKQTLRFYLYIPDDAGQLEKKRHDPGWFRHQLAAQLLETFPDAFDNEVAPPVWTGTEDLQDYIDTVARWADREDHQPLLIIDGLDHALRPFGDTTQGDQIADTVLEELGALDFPSPLTLLVVSRPLSSRKQDELRVDTSLTVPAWTDAEITRYLEENSVTPTGELVERLEAVSGGLPVILAHLLRQAESFDGDLEAGLQQALADASDVDGDLETYYETVWEPLRPHERDAATLIALSPTGLDAETVDAVIDFPWVQQALAVDTMPVSHIIDEVGDRRLRVFHDSFRAFILDRLDSTEIDAGHRRLFDHLFERCVQAPARLDRLRYHAEKGPGQTALKDLVSLDRVLRWWENGVYVDRVREAIELAFDAASRDGDYVTAFDCTILGGVTREMLDVYAEDTDRLAFYTACGDREAAVRLVSQLREYEGGTAEALTAMQTIARNWEEEIDRDWIQEWEQDYRAADQPSWDATAYFELAAVLLHPDEFWDLAGELVRPDTEEHFTREVLAAVQRRPDVLDYWSEPPDWLFENPLVALESCQRVGHRLPEPWREALAEHAPALTEISLAGLHTLVVCGGPEDDIVQIVEDQSLAKPERRPAEEGPPFSEAYYVGAILASCNRSSEELLATVDGLASEQSPAHQFLALTGAATTRAPSAETQGWVDTTLNFLVDRYDAGTLLEDSIHPRDRWAYTKAVEAGVQAFVDIIEAGTPDDVQRVHELAASTRGEVGPLLQTISRALVGTYPDEMLPTAFEEEYEAILTRPPQTDPPTRDLLDLAVAAAEAGYNETANQYFETAIERCFRYGYRKDVFLNDVWKGFQDIVDEWDRHRGQAIRLLNWARLLHDLTDGKETGHYEGMFLTTLLDDGVIEFQPALANASQRSTITKLRDWRLDNPAGISRMELEGIVEAELVHAKTRKYTDKKVQVFGRTAVIAADNGWNELVVQSLRAMSIGEYIDEGVDADLAQRVQDLADQYDVSIPDDIEADGEASASEEVDQEFPSEHEDLHRLLASHADDAPLTEVDFQELTTEELRTAGRLLQSRDYYYDSPAAAPLARVLAEREGPEAGVDLLIEVIAERDLMSWWVGGFGFEPLAEALVDLCGDDALQAVLTAWRRSSMLDAAGYQTVFPQLVWIVKRTEGQIAAEELFSHTMQWLNRLFWPYEDRVQVWGKLADQQ